jgi:hypothetical protein
MRRGLARRASLCVAFGRLGRSLERLRSEASAHSRGLGSWRFAWSLRPARGRVRADRVA